MPSVLESKLAAALQRTAVRPQYQAALNHFLIPLSHRDEATYNHCIRIGLYAEAVARELGFDPRAAVMAGALHDIGKLLVPTEVLQRTTHFSQADRDAVRPHPEYAYRMLRDVMEFTAQIALRHHRFQIDPYPIVLPDCAMRFHQSVSDRFDTYANVVALIDFYDAATTRANSAGVIADHAEVKRRFAELRPAQASLANHLIDVGVLHTGIVK